MKTLGEFIIEKQAEYPQAKGELSGILSSIRLAAKFIHREINHAGLSKDILGVAGSENIQGEAQMKLDVFANETMKKPLLHVRKWLDLPLKKMTLSSHLILNVLVMQNIF